MHGTEDQVEAPRSLPRHDGYACFPNHAEVLLPLHDLDAPCDLDVGVPGPALGDGGRDPG